jgi:hypothetical protein
MALAVPGAVRPDRALFFRGTMATIISRALTDLAIAPVPSRRAFALTAALTERADAVYPTLPGYSDTAPPPFGGLDGGPPEDAPDALRGEAWQFVELPLEALEEEAAGVRSGASFGAVFDARAVMGPAAPPPGAPIPGVAVYSRRALPLAAWTAGYEVAAVRADTERGCLVLETGVGARWKYAAIPKTAAVNDEAVAWEAAKAAANGLHFLVVQDGEEADVAGLWLLWDSPPPAV